MYTSTKISEIVEGKLIGKDNNQIVINQLLTDSRRLRDPQQTLFFAIKSERNNGINYINDLYNRNVRCFVIQEDIDFLKYKDASFIKVKNTLDALQKLTEYHRSQFNIPIIGITGSNGKTIIKEWLFELLKQDKNITRSPRSYNSQIGVPLSVWMLNKESELGIFEAGISQAGEMSNLEKIIHPSIGIFTNIGEAHQENFIDYKHKISEKIKLFAYSQTIIYCKDNQLIDLQFSNSPLFEDKTLLTWSKKYAADLHITHIKQNNNSTNIIAKYQKNEIQITIPFVDKASTENLIHIWLLMLHLGYDSKTIENRMQKLSNVSMRLEQKQGINNCTIINDSYNSDIGSLNIALDFLTHQNQHNKRTLILSDILQTGRDLNNLYKEVIELIKTAKINRFIAIGKDLSSVRNLFPKDTIFYKNTSDFLKNINIDSFQNEAILLKGARKFEFEQISNFLQNKNHETVLEINLSALIDNVNYFRSLLKPETKIMAMVKAFSYGAGSVEIANVLQFHNIDYLAVAYADEGITLRKTGISLPIMVMNPEEMSLEQIIRYNLEPEIYNFRILKAYHNSIRQNGTVYAPIHIKLETGMNRLGFQEEELDEMIRFIKNNPTLKVKSVFSHLSASDEAHNDDFTQIQIQKFEQLSQIIIKELDYPIIRHLSNSSGVERHPNALFDMVRLGIGMYGISPSNNKKLKNVSTLKTTISQIKKIKSNQTIGYSRKGKLEKDGKIAILQIGYADGIRRNLSNGKGKFLVNGKFAPIVGNVCMDMVMLNVTGIDCKEDDEAFVFSAKNPITEMAKCIGTIPYEILTSYSPRVRRVFKN